MPSRLPAPEPPAKPARPKPLRGPEPWKTVRGVIFTQWDRWLLVLAANTDGGLDGVRTAIMTRTRTRFGFAPEHEDKEAKLSQVDHLVGLLKSAGITAAAVLGADAKHRGLLARARTKVLDQEVADRDKTPAMRSTPRERFEARALRGRWSSFPVSPAKYEPLFAPERDFFTLDQTSALVRRLGNASEKAAKRVDGRPAELLALHRAMLTVILVAIEGADDSCGELGDFFTETIEQYAAVDWKSAAIDPEVYFHDIIEFAVWEDYGLTDELVPFFKKSARAPAALVEGVLAKVGGELRAEGTFGYQLQKLAEIRASFMIAYRRFYDFVPLATELGSDQWMPVVAMAEAAMKARKKDLALAVFTAANRPGAHREHLQRECRRITGKKSATAPRLRLVRSEHGAEAR